MNNNYNCMGVWEDIGPIFLQVDRNDLIHNGVVNPDNIPGSEEDLTNVKNNIRAFINDINDPVSYLVTSCQPYNSIKIPGICADKEITAFVESCQTLAFLSSRYTPVLYITSSDEKLLYGKTGLAGLVQVVGNYGNEAQAPVDPNKYDIEFRTVDINGNPIEQGYDSFGFAPYEPNETIDVNTQGIYYFRVYVQATIVEL